MSMFRRGAFCVPSTTLSWFYAFTPLQAAHNEWDSPEAQQFRREHKQRLDREWATGICQSVAPSRSRLCLRPDIGEPIRRDSGRPRTPDPVRGTQRSSHPSAVVLARAWEAAWMVAWQAVHAAVSGPVGFRNPRGSVTWDRSWFSGNC